MALISAGAMFKIFTAKTVHKQAVKLRPVEHHYEKDGEEPYIKYGCQICEQLADEAAKISKGACLHEEFKEGKRFNRFSFAYGTRNCPCCGVNLDWDYKKASDGDGKECSE